MPLQLVPMMQFGDGDVLDDEVRVVALEADGVVLAVDMQSEIVTFFPSMSIPSLFWLT